MTTHDTDTPDDDPRAHWRFTSGADWFTNWLSHIKAGRFDRDTRWCAQWWRHDEVVIRLEELWKAWETARLSEDLAAKSGNSHFKPFDVIKCIHLFIEPSAHLHSCISTDHGE